MRKILVYLAASFLLSFPCVAFLNSNSTMKKASASSSAPLPVRTIAHKGHIKDEDGNVICKENTYQSFYLASQNNFYGIECDIYTTSDNHLVTYHDASIDISEPTNTDTSVGDWRTLNSLTLEQLLSLNIGTISDPAYMCRFEDYIELCRSSGKHAFIEIKDHPTDSVLEKQILDCIYQQGLASNSTILSFDADNILRVKRYADSTNRGYKCHFLANKSRNNEDTGILEIPYDSTDWISAEDVVSNGISISIFYPYASEELIDLSHFYNVDVGAWTVNGYDVAETLINRGIDFITTDEFYSDEKYLPNYVPFVNLDTDDWVKEDAYGVENIYLDGPNSYLFQNLTAYGERVRYKNLVLLDGLSFDIHIDSFRGTSDSNYSNVGFYFSSWNERYVFDNEDYAAFSFLNNKYNASISQDRFGIFNSENTDKIINNYTKNNVVNFSNDTLSNKGFGYDDGTLIMNHRPVTALHFSFEKYNDRLYKITISEIYNNVIWNYNDGKTANYDSGSLYTFVEASRFDLDANGRAYLFLYSIGKNNFNDFDKHVSNINQNAKKIKIVTNNDLAISDIYVKSGTKIKELPTLTKEGYDFVGWYSRSDFSKSFDINETVIEDDITLFAKWDIKTFTVKFNTDGGTLIDDQIINYNNVVIQPNNPTKDGYHFVGWYLDEGYEKEYSFTKKVKEDVILYAKYEAIDGYYTPLTLVIVFTVIGVVLVGGLTVLYVYKSNKVFNARFKINQARKEFNDRNKEE